MMTDDIERVARGQVNLKHHLSRSLSFATCISVSLVVSDITFCILGEANDSMKKIDPGYWSFHLLTSHKEVKNHKNNILGQIKP